MLAHEYGHHVQNLPGILERRDRRDTGPTSDAVRSELMADCLAGAWAANAVETGFIERLTEQDIAGRPERGGGGRRRPDPGEPRVA